MRAAVSLARLRRDQGRHAEARLTTSMLDSQDRLSGRNAMGRLPWGGLGDRPRREQPADQLGSPPEGPPPSGPVPLREGRRQLRPGQHLLRAAS